MPITAAEMQEQGKVIDLDTLVEKLSTTEPVGQREFAMGDEVEFHLGDDWNDNFNELRPDEPVDASIRLGPKDGERQEIQLSKDAILEATSVTGLDKGFVGRTPGHLIEPILNYKYQGGMGDRALKVLTAGPDSTGLAITRATITPFSNLELLESALQAIRKQYGESVEVYADSKINHTLRRTDMRLIIPEDQRDILSERHTEDNPDTWSGGVYLRNSLNGELQTAIEAYLFAWWCTNGCITEHASSGTSWNRKSKGQEAKDVYEWARLSVEEAIGGLEHQFEMVDAMKDQSLDHDVDTVLQDIFSTHGVPVKVRESVIKNMVDSTDDSPYGVMQALTQAGNNPDLPPKMVERVQRVGGLLPAVAHSRCSECHRLNLN